MKAAFEIQSSDAGKRLDVFLTEQLPEFSRSKIQKAIKGGGATVNEKEEAVPHHFLKEGDVVAITVTTLVPEPVEGPSTTAEQSSASAQGVIIVAEEPEYVIINKPSGLLVHRTEFHEKHTLAHWIRQHYPECTSVGDDPEIRPGIVHRLDKEASGLIVIARTQEAFDHLKSQFKIRTVKKEYHVLTHGILADDFGEIDFTIARSEQHARMAARPISQDGKEALTQYEIVTRYTNATLAKVTPKSGRTHQIRVHFFAINHALIGDPLYIHKKDNHKLDKACGRLFLHATRLQFNDLHGEVVEYESALPEELAGFLETLKPSLKH